MSDDTDWIGVSILKAKQKSAPVPEGVWTELDVLLRGSLGERLQPAMKLESVARHLIELMSVATRDTRRPD